MDVLRFVLIISLGICTSFTSSKALIPLADGTWLSSGRGSWTVNSTTISGFSSTLSADSPTSTLTYVSNTGTLYLFSTTTTIFNVIAKFYTCLDIQISATSAPVFYVVTVFNASVTDRFTDDSTAACSNTGYQTADNRHVLVQQGAETSLTAGLPNVIRGEYSVNLTSVSGVTSDGITLDTCNNTVIMQFNRTGGQNVGFTGSGLLISLYNIQSGTQTYVYTYNNDSSVDGSTTHRLVCWVISPSTSGVSATVYPGTCQPTQNATYTPAGGQLLSLTASVSCAVTDESSDSSNTLIIIVVVVVVIIVIVIIVIVIVVVIKKKKCKKGDDDDDDLKKGTTRDVSVSTSVFSGESSCLPWLGRGTKTVSTSTTDLNSITFYLPLKYTKRPGETNNASTSNKRPGTASLHRSKSEVTNVDENGEKDKTSKQQFRFVQYVGVVKKDTKTKAVVDTRWQNGHTNSSANDKDTKPKPVAVQEELNRAKTFHDFEREFDENHKFPTVSNSYDKWANTKREKSNIENKTTQKTTIGDSSQTSKQGESKKVNIVRVKSEEELEQVPTNKNEEDSNTNKSVEDKKVYFRRSRTIPGINYTSPYAMTREQKEFIAKRKEWVNMQHNHEKSKQKWLKDLKKKESEKAYHNWIRNKATMADRMRASFRRTQSQTSQSLEPTVPKKS